MKKVAILGRPNVGKSSLFNRLARKRDAITSDVSGTTRDIKKNIVTISEDREFELLDTGGIDESDALFSKVAEMSKRAAKEADVILYMVDGKKLPDEEDKKLFYELQALDKPIALIVNKIDNDKEEQERFWEFIEFGAENVFPISVSHNRKLNPLYKWLERYIPPAEKTAQSLQADEDFSLEQLLEMAEQPQEEEDRKIKVAILGRPNVGKSSLLNALLGEERSVVSEVAGTTIDPVDETIIHGDYEITFVDTAGIRRRSKILGIEKYALGRTEKMLQEADIALLLIDATTGVTELDERIAGLIDKYKLGALIVVNKWDIRGEKEYKEAIQDIRDELKFLHYAPIITVSAKTKQRVSKILDQITAIYERYKQRIPTSKLNEAIQYAIRRHHVPSHHGQVVRIKFATQYATKPPRIALVVNKPGLLHFSYIRYLANTLREQFDFEGVPLEIVARKRGERSDEEE
ncbi:ribosome biogenesis GTPase Der [Nitratifractor salsuginis]|uniref:GTPase Der n=1 Tax=Nitratifractor salsuginis (strain DSM 16511 / JCM 12458 / E9I37-1) TaxID=749222 RepID=E6X1I3_NITSE|nr:ribosome biogenesis GTPase Der [Nitratifractor salsuginis]ADV45916.1 ribosome-associated GTPase EngA [Nitratifractor salsuginis DSM 16511]